MSIFAASATVSAWARRSSKLRPLISGTLATALAMAGIAGVGRPFPAVAVPPLFQFTSSGWEGGNFQNVVAISPDGGSVMTGGDMSGIQRSTNGGANFSSQNLLLGSKAVASIVFNGALNEVYAATSGGLYAASTATDPLTWSPRWQPVQQEFSGIELDQFQNMGRPVGTLIAVDPHSSSTLYAATLGGIQRSTDDGAHWAVLSVDGLEDRDHPIRGLAIESGPNQTTVYAAASGEAPYRIPNAYTCQPGGTPACTHYTMTLPGSISPGAEEFAADGAGRVYAADGISGIYRSSDHGQSWTNIDQGKIQTDGPLWEAVAAASDGTVVVGASNPDQECPQPQCPYDAVFFSTDTGNTWTAPALANIGCTVFGPGAERWWVCDGNPDYQLGHKDFTAEQIAINPLNTTELYVSGKAGLWFSNNRGPSWQPMVHGMMVAQARAITRDPNPASTFYMGSADYTFLYSTTGMQSVVRQRLGKPPHGNVRDHIAVDPATSPSTVFVVNGDDGVADWEIFYSRDAARTDATWTDALLQNQFSDGISSLSGLAVTEGSGNFVVLVGVQTEDAQGQFHGQGMWRGVYNPSSGLFVWTRVNGSNSIMTGSTAQGTTIFIPGTGIAYVLDDTTGLWRTPNIGAGSPTWLKINPGSQGPEHGDMILDPTNPSKVYVQQYTGTPGLYRIDNADQSSYHVSPLVVSGAYTQPSVLGMSYQGDLLVAEGQDDQSGIPHLWMSSNPTIGMPQFDPIDDAVYRSTVFNPVGMAVDLARHVYVAGSPSAVIIGTPVGSR
jgi:hypothetical protein